LGSNGNRYGTGMTAVTFKWIAECHACGLIRRRHRKPKNNRSCGRCSPVFNPAFQLHYILNTSNR
jgi:hypothetical protein